MKINAYGLIELLFVIALAAIAALLSIHYYSQVRDSQKVTELQMQMQGIYKAMIQCLSSQGPTATQCTSINGLIAAGLLSNGYSKNPWGGSFFFSTFYKIGVQTTVTISASQVPAAACTILQGRLGNSKDTVFPVGTSIAVTDTSCELNLPSVQL